MRFICVLAVALMFGGCSSSKTNEDANHDTEETGIVVMKLAQVDSIKKVIEREPSKKGEAADELTQVYRELAIASQGQTDEAKFLFKEAVAFHQLKGDLNEAFGLYNAVTKQFPESPYAAESEFHMAMIVHQFYQDTGKAVQLFQEFIGRHPNHDMAEMARQMIYQASRSAEDIFNDIQDSLTRKGAN